jgi:hypothetical protein
MQVLKLLPLVGCLIGACWMVPVSAQGEVYRWVDESGQVHYSEKKDVTGSQVQALKISTTLPAAVLAAEASVPVAAASAQVATRVASARPVSMAGNSSLIFRQAPHPRGVVVSSR